MFVHTETTVTVLSALNTAMDAVKPAVTGVWDVITNNQLLTFWVGTAVLSSGFWALRKAKRIVQ